MMWGRRVAVIVVVALLAACGGGGEETTTGTTAGDGAGQEAAPSGEETTTTEAEKVVMPDLVGRTEDEARRELDDRGVDESDILVDERESLEKAGTVIDQVPSSGQPVTGSVNLIVAKPVGPVPDFVGQQLSDVEEWAEERGIDVRVEEVLDDGPADGEVLGSTPAAGEEATSEILVQVARTPVISQLGDMGEVGDDCSPQVGEVSVNGDTYPNSVYHYGTEYGCEFEYNLGRDWEVFKATVGLSDDSDSGGQVRFEVFGDGTSLFNQVVGLGAVGQIDVDVSGVLRLSLKATQLNGDDLYGVWGNARVIGSPNDVGDDDGSTSTTEG